MPVTKSSSSASNQEKEKRKRERRNADWNDPERRRLKAAHAAATPFRFLPHPATNGVGKISLARRDSDSNSNNNNNNNNNQQQQQGYRHCHALKALFHSIVANVEGGVTWGDGQGNDPRRRMYGFMPGQRRALLSAGIKIQPEGAEDDREHVNTLRLASVDLAFPQRNCTDDARIRNHRQQHQHQVMKTDLLLDQSVYDALLAITKQVQALVPSRYKIFVTIEQLVAAQPNLHNGTSYLPAHLDFPRRDGFGVVIVTFGVSGSAVIVLINDGDEDDGDDEDDDDGSSSFSFQLNENEAYILSGDARNKYIHGVLCLREQTSCHRETLNLRYGLHSPEFARTEVDQHWPE